MTPAEQASEMARGSFSTGCNCAESVLDAVAASLDLGEGALARSSGYAWTGGIDESGCLCGALAAAVSLAGQVAASEGGTERQQRARARELADEIRREFVGRWQGTCCRVVRDGRDFGTPECRENCADVTAFATQLSIDVLGRGRSHTQTATGAGARIAASAGTGLLLGLEAAWVAAAMGGDTAAGAVLLLALAGLAWGALAATRVDARRALARPGRIVAAVAVSAAALLALLSAGAPVLATAVADRVAAALGVADLGLVLQALWVAVPVVWAAPAVFDLARRRGAR